MKHKKTKQRFTLNKRTIATLGVEAQRKLKGGAPLTETCGCDSVSCEPCATFDPICFTKFADCVPVTVEDSICQCVFTDACQSEIAGCASDYVTCYC